MLSILVQGLTMGPLLRRLGLAGTKGLRAEYERLTASLRAQRAALAAVESALSETAATSAISTDVRTTYSSRIDETEARLRDLQEQEGGLRSEQRRSLLRRALFAEKNSLLSARRSGQVSEEDYETLAADVDSRLFELEEHG